MNTVAREALEKLDDATGELRFARIRPGSFSFAWSIVTRIRDTMEERKKEQRIGERKVCRLTGWVEPIERLVIIGLPEWETVGVDNEKFWKD